MPLGERSADANNKILKTYFWIFQEFYSIFRDHHYTYHYTNILLLFRTQDMVDLRIAMLLF